MTEVVTLDQEFGGIEDGMKEKVDEVFKEKKKRGRPRKVVEPVEKVTSNREARILGGKGQSRARELAIREDEANYWATVFLGLADGRRNKKATPEARNAYKTAAKMLAQDVVDPEGL